jgi:hypothetical protein
MSPRKSWTAQDRMRRQLDDWCSQHIQLPAIGVIRCGECGAGMAARWRSAGDAVKLGCLECGLETDIGRKVKDWTAAPPAIGLDATCPVCDAPPGKACDAKGRLHDARRGLLTSKPNPGLSSHGYYEKQVERFPEMMEALGKEPERQSCETCDVRMGLGNCSNCVLRVMRGAGVDGLDLWFDQVALHLEGKPSTSTAKLLAWYHGYDVELRGK